MDFLYPMVPGRFSVIIPSFQQGQFIERTLLSLLDQRDPDLEIIVQDGGSRDATVEILRKYGEHISWQSAPDNGQASAINSGLRRSTGEFACYLNSDDVLYPNTLKVVREAFISHPHAGFIYGEANHIGEKDEVLECYPIEEWNYFRLLQTCYLCQPATFWRREVHETIGGFNEALHFCMDYEFWLRAGQKFEFIHLSDVLAGSRRHSETKTNRLRQTGHREIVAIIPQFNGGKLPLKWARARAKTEAEARLRKGDFVPWAWTKYCLTYWYHLLTAFPKIESRSFKEFLRKLSPPYPSSRKHLERTEPVIYS